MILNELNNLSVVDAEQLAEAELAAFQAVFLEALDCSKSAEEVLWHLDKSAISSELSEYIKFFEPRMIEVARELTQRWGKRQNK